MRIRHTLPALLLGLGLAGSSQAAPDGAAIRFSTSPVPVGSGARAMGMGGAFVAVADDATAASWNPGGLFQLERPELSVVYGMTSRSESYGSSDVSDFNIDNSVSAEALNYLSFVYPFQALRRNMMLSLNYQRLYELDKEFKFDIDTDFNVGGSNFTGRTRYDVLRKGSIKALAPAYALQIYPTLAIGATFNIWNGLGSNAENGWQERTNSRFTAVVDGQPIDQTLVNEHLYENFRGFNMNIGLLWDPHPVFTLGAVVKTPFTARIDHKYQQITAFSLGEDGGQVDSSPKGAKDTVKVDWPWVVALGGAARVSDELTLSFDATYTDWNEFVMESCSGEGENRICAKTSPISGQPESETDLQATLQLRFGMEYLIILKRTVVPVRAGLLYDPEPAPGSPEKIYGWTLGTGISWEDYFDSGNDLIFDLAWQARVGSDLNGGLSGIPGSKMDLFQNTILLSAIHHF